MVEPRINLAALHEQVMKISDQDEHVRRIVASLGAQHDRLSLDALTSGAMPGDFRVALVMRGHRGLVSELR